MHFAPISTLPNSGLIIEPVFHRNRNFGQIINQHDITRTSLESAGFLLFQDYQPQEIDIESEKNIPDNRMVNGILRDVSGTQLIHKDGDGNKHLLMLRYEGESDRRDADTIIASNQEKLYQLFLGFIHEHYNAFLEKSFSPKPIEELNHLIQKNGIDGVADKISSASRDGQNWRSFIFQGFGISVIGNPILNDFYSEAFQEKLIYVHRWKNRDLLLVDNAKMLHARKMRPETDGPFSTASVKRAFYKWNETDEIEVIIPEV